MEQKDIDVAIEGFAKLLEKAGLENAQILVEEKLQKEAKSKGISLLKAAWEYASYGMPGDPSHFHLHMALTQINNIDLNKLPAVNEPLL